MFAKSSKNADIMDIEDYEGLLLIIIFKRF
jgi:hypothetical protein